MYIKHEFVNLESWSRSTSELGLTIGWHYNSFIPIQMDNQNTIRKYMYGSWYQIAKNTLAQLVSHLSDKLSERCSFDSLRGEPGVVELRQ
jgi:hypothetical protein